MQTLKENIELATVFGEYALVRINENNLRDVDILHQAVYGSHRPKDYYYKKYNTAYAGATHTAFIAYSSARLPVAYYGVVPCFLQCGETIVLAAQSTDTMTHPEFRKKGLLTELHNLVIQLCTSLEIKILFGFGNQDSIPIYKHKYNWEENGIMDRFEIPVSPSSIGVFNRIPILKRIFKTYQKIILRRHTLPQLGIVCQDIKSGYCGVHRDSRYLEHKKYSGTMVISAGKSKAWIKLTHDLMIGDIELNGNSVEEVISGLKKIARKIGIQKIHFCASQGSFLYNQLIRRYAAIPAFPVLYKDLGSRLELSNIKFTFADLDIF